MYCIRHIQNSCIFKTLFFQVYASIINHIQRYRGIFTRIETLLRHFQAYPGIFSTLCNQPCHILSPSIFKTGGLFNFLWNVDLAYSEPCHRAVFRYIQSVIQNFQHIQQILEYSAPFHNRIPNHIQNPVILTKIYEFSELRHILNHTHIQDPLKDLRLTFLRK